MQVKRFGYQTRHPVCVLSPKGDRLDGLVDGSISYLDLHPESQNQSLSSCIQPSPPTFLLCPMWQTPLHDKTINQKLDWEKLHYNCFTLKPDPGQLQSKIDTWKNISSVKILILPVEI